MRVWMLLTFLAVGAALYPAVAHAEIAAGDTVVDFASLQGNEGLAPLLEPVGLLQGDDGTTRRFYIAPIVGASWGQLLVDGPLFAQQNLFTAGGAAGVAITRPLGQVRIEAEGRYRDGFGGTLGTVDIGATDNWSSLVNVWRDFGITKNLGVYGGGGIGAGGYRFTAVSDGNTFFNEQQTAFAWQIGTGVIYAVSDRVTLDLGYRYYSVSPVSVCDCGGRPGDYVSQFVSNELLLAVRIYEPFRGLRR